MTCRQCQRLLSPYLDDVLESDERSAVLAHLAQCLVCAERFQQLEENRQLLRALPVGEVTPAMEFRMQARLYEQEGTVQSVGHNPFTASRPWWRGWGMLSAGTLVTCAASFVFYFSTMQVPPPVSAEAVAESMDDLIMTLDSDDEMRVIGEETEDETEGDWQEDLDQWPVGDGIE